MSRSILFFIFSLIMIRESFEQFKVHSSVSILNENNFETKVLKSNDFWLILFYSSENKSCKTFIPIYEKFAKATKGLFHIGAIDSSKDNKITDKYNIKVFPTLKLLGVNKEKPLEYDYELNIESLISFIFEKTKKIVEERLTELRKVKKKVEINPSTEKKKEEEIIESDENVIVLTDKDFDKKVLKSKEMWMVVFYAPWCMHCKRLLPQWNAAANALKGKVNIAKIDATTNKNMVSRYNISGYPTIKVFLHGNKKENEVEEYEGTRKKGDIVKYALDKLENSKANK